MADIDEKRRKNTHRTVLTLSSLEDCCGLQIQHREVANQEAANQEAASQEVANQEVANQEVANPEKAKNSEAGRKPISDVNMFSSVPSDPAPKKPKQPFLRRGAGLNRFNMKLVKKQSPGKAIIATIPSKGRNPSRPRISSSRTSRTSDSSVRTSASSRSLSPTISKRPASVRFEEEESSEDDDEDDDDHLVVDAERDVILENARQMKTARSEEAAIQAYLPPLKNGDPESEPLSIQEQLELQSTSDSVAQACNAQVRMSREKAEEVANQEAANQEAASQEVANQEVANQEVANPVTYPGA
ncbi:unnamed protein product [Cyprideis torosa]|uniref:Uncharacterized protein n=1 Tax=Cyprideis torosa TaxID=163714 RepID=A0A7R8WLJ2_9CRUS|nr:unnamed protein product [Cyprideis torosa]CAG0898156.1 unnamed protein product [Cyprideis torosa]